MLITGSGSGIGRLCAVEFAKLGARLVLWDIDEKSNRHTQEIIEREGFKSFTYKVDLSDRKQIYEAAKKVKEEVGEVDILFNNAGIVSGKKLFDCSDELMEKTMAVNTNALFYMAKAFLPSMFEKNHGHVITMASMAGHFGVNGLVDYCASKYGAVGFNEALRSEVHTTGKDITVTTINTFYVDTGMFSGIKDFSPLMFPILKPNYVVARIVEAVLTDTENLYLPKTCHLYLLIKGILHSKSLRIIAEYFGLNHTMDDYVGRS